MDKSLFYDPSKLLSYNRILNFIIGARGIGKTYGFKKFVVKQFLKNKAQFVYIRRYKSELIKVGQFFQDISAEPEFEGIKFEVKGRKLYINGELAGYAIPLSAWQNEKSTSYPNVENILFDEFIREKDMGRYLPNEVGAFLNLCDTIIRNRDNARILCMSNSVSIVNPYFLYFSIVPDLTKRFYKTKTIVVEIPKSDDFAKERAKTRFGSLIKGTNYAEMALENKFTGDSYVFVEKRSKESTHVFNVTYDKQTVGIWTDGFTMYMSDSYDSYCRYHYVIQKEDMDDGRILVRGSKASYHLVKLMGAFEKGLLRFDDLKTRTLGYEILKRL